MTQDEFFEYFNKLCRSYQKNPEKLVAVGLEYYKNSDGSTSKLGQITSFEFGLIIDYCKEKRIKPDYGEIPQYYQLLGFYEDQIRPTKIYDDQQKLAEIEDCQLCDNTGFVPMFDMLKGNNFVCSCYCKKGESIIENARKRNGVFKIFITSYKQIKNNSGYILEKHVDDTIVMMSKEIAEKNRNKKFDDKYYQIGKLEARKVLTMLSKQSRLPLERFL